MCMCKYETYRTINAVLVVVTMETLYRDPESDPEPAVAGVKQEVTGRNLEQGEMTGEVMEGVKWRHGEDRRYIKPADTNH